VVDGHEEVRVQAAGPTNQVQNTTDELKQNQTTTTTTQQENNGNNNIDYYYCQGTLSPSHQTSHPKQPTLQTQTLPDTHPNTSRPMDNSHQPARTTDQLDRMAIPIYHQPTQTDQIERTPTQAHQIPLTRHRTTHPLTPNNSSIKSIY
jgi:hypothetical protein